MESTENNKEKIGILTHYYKSDNYGGVLQAYALCRYFEKLGYKTQQIRIPVRPICFEQRNKKEIRHSWIIRVINKIQRMIYGVDVKCRTRSISVMQFANNMVPHSEKIYSNDDISLALNEYDVFVTGSDQVWNTDYFVPAFFLEFVNNKIKFSYAASVAKDRLSENEVKFMSSKLNSFTGISVRERQTADLLQDYINQKIELVLDPVFLLRRDEWEKLICDNKLYDENYVFAYFLGDNSVARKIASQYAQENGLELISFPYMNKKYDSADRQIKGKKVWDASPVDFVSIIANAQAIITDSFHATAFSIIFHKRFVVTQRSVNNEMVSRIYSLLQIVGEENKFFTNQDWIRKKRNVSIDNYKFEQWDQLIEEYRTKSYKFIDRCLTR